MWYECRTFHHLRRRRIFSFNVIVNIVRVRCLIICWCLLFSLRLFFLLLIIYACFLSFIAANRHHWHDIMWVIDLVLKCDWMLNEAEKRWFLWAGRSGLVIHWFIFVCHLTSVSGSWTYPIQLMLTLHVAAFVNELIHTSVTPFTSSSFNFSHLLAIDHWTSKSSSASSISR